MKLTSLLYKSLTALFIFCFTMAYSEPFDSISVETYKGVSSVKYKVDKGNTFYSLSKRFKISADKIKSFNDISELKLDQIIYLPLEIGGKTSPKKTSNVHTVQAGETLYTISRENNVSVEELKKINNLTGNSLSVGQELKLNNQPSTYVKNTQRVTKKVSKTHVVDKGETLYSISKKYNVSVDEIKSWNNLTNNALLLNQSLIVSVPKEQSSSKLKIKKEVHLINSKSSKLDSGMSEVLCIYGNVGDVIQIMYQGKKSFARIVGKSDDSHLYASKKVFETLSIETFSQNVDIAFNQSKN